MLVNIGPFINWVGPYQILDKLLLVEYEKLPLFKQREKLSSSLAKWFCDNTPLEEICSHIYQKQSRRVKVTLASYDTWNMDDTLTLIIGPMLEQLKRQKHGSPFVDDGDVPEHLRSYSLGAYEDLEPYDLDHNFHLRYDWVLDELIWAFTTPHHKIKFDLEGDEYNSYEQRIQNAYQLFGKYYQTLWS